MIEPDVLSDVTTRVRRVEGRIGGLVRMIDEGRDCRDVACESRCSRAVLLG